MEDFIIRIDGLKKSKYDFIGYDFYEDDSDYAFIDNATEEEAIKVLNEKFNQLVELGEDNFVLFLQDSNRDTFMYLARFEGKTYKEDYRG